MGNATYILPITVSSLRGFNELTGYLLRLRRIAPQLQLIVVDGSPVNVFAAHARRWSRFVTHVRPASLRCLNGKVRGVLTGFAFASHDKIIIADEEIRYDARSLAQMIDALDHAEVVRPQSYFMPDTWQTLVDSSSALINRATGGDWPGTLGVRRHVLHGGYIGDVLFENLELVRTVRASGGRELVAHDIFVARRPANNEHFFGHRIRQAYSEFARPMRMALALLTLPLTVLAIVALRFDLLAVFSCVALVTAETGRMRAGAYRYFSFRSSLAAPFWILEQSVCAWLAVAMRLYYGGIPHSGSVIQTAATPSHLLVERIREPHIHEGRRTDAVVR
jgi:hypothetical protein